MRMGTADLESIDGQGAIERRVKQLFVHPKYTPGEAYYDVGIAEADKIIEFSKYIRPVCLPYLPIDNDDYLSDEFVTQAGWLQDSGIYVLARNQTALTSNLKLRNIRVCINFNGLVYNNSA